MPDAPLSAGDLSREDVTHIAEHLAAAYQANSGDQPRFVIARQHASYYLAYLGTQQAQEYLENAMRTEPSELVLRAIMVGMSLYCGRGDIFEQYIDRLRTNPEAASVNIGYHLVYYGDQPQDEGYSDMGGAKCDSTVQAIIRHLGAYQYRAAWPLDLLTLRMLVSSRGKQILQINSGYSSFLTTFLSQRDDNEGQLFVREKRELENALKGAKTQ